MSCTIDGHDFCIFEKHGDQDIAGDMTIKCAVCGKQLTLNVYEPDGIFEDGRQWALQ